MRRFTAKISPSAAAPHRSAPTLQARRVSQRRTDRFARLSAYLAPGALAAAVIATCALLSAKRWLWYDEIVTINLLTDPSIGHMLAAMADGAEAAPPLYHFLARGWAALFGDSRHALRLFSAVGMAIAGIVVWSRLRYAFGGRAAAVGALTAFCGSAVVAQQASVIRFYGVYMAAAAACLWLAHAAMTQVTPPRLPRLAAIAACHATLVLSHLFGFFYSGALLVSILAWDLWHGRRQVGVYLAIVIGWLAYVPWVGSTYRQAQMGKPHNWLEAPLLADLVGAYQFGIAVLPAVVLAIVLLSAMNRNGEWGVRGRTETADGGAASLAKAHAMLLLAAALMAVPLGVFVISRTVTAVFLDRYLLPSTFGWAIVLAYLVRALTAEEPSRRWWDIVPWAALCASLVLYPIYFAARANPTERPGVVISTIVRDSLGGVRLPVAVEEALQFLPLEYYGRGTPQGDFRFVLDWDSALDPRSHLAATMQFKGMRIYRRVGYLDPHEVEDARSFLCREAPFLVADNAHFGWVDRRITSSPHFDTRVLGTYGDPHGDVTIRWVQRRVPCTAPGAAPLFDTPDPPETPG